MVDDYTSTRGGAVYCLGTWHTHLRESGPSDIDRRTAETLAVARALPCTILIRTPSGYRAIVVRRPAAEAMKGE